MHKLKSSKFWMTVVLILGMAALNVNGSVTSNDFVEFTKWALGIWTAGNVGSKFSNVAKQKAGE